MDEGRVLKGAVVALQRGDARAAVAAADQCVARRPRLAIAHLVRGRALLAHGDTPVAIAALKEAVRLDPRSAEAQATLGDALRFAGRIAEAERVHARALGLAPDSASVRVRAAHTSLDAGDLARAEQLVRPLAERGDPGALTSLVDILERRGALDEAVGWIESRPEAAGGSVEAAIVSARTLRQVGRNADGLALLEGIDAASLASASRSSLFHALGDARDCAGQHRGAFSAWSEANRLRAVRFDAKAFAARVDAILGLETREHSSGLPASRRQEERPVFVLGIPRSGTSLVEQILATHHRVLACGERDDLPRLCRGLDRSSRRAIERAARRYISGLPAASEAGRAGAALRITDKLPHNAFFLGTAAQLFPAARVVYCTRDALDTGLSIFSRDFHATHDYATDLHSIAAFQRGYGAVMAHWREHLQLPIFELNYETLIAEPEKTMRELLCFCGLEWDDAVLRFHENSRVVATASRAQVRKPLSANSIGRWRHYASEIEPLRQALGS